MTKTAEMPYPLGRTYRQSPYKGVPPSPGILAKLFFCVFMRVENHKHAKKKTRPISSHLDRISWSINDFLHGMKPKKWSLILRDRGPFLESPELYGPFSGVTIPLVSQERKGLKVTKLHSQVSFCYFENMLKDRLSKTSGWQFTNGFSGPKSFRDFRETGPR